MPQGKQDYTGELINQVIRETGYSRETVRQVVESFLAILQEQSCEEEILIKGFGELKATLVKRIYYDINTKNNNASVIKPRVFFKPAVAYENMINRTCTFDEEEGIVIGDRNASKEER